MLQMIVSVDALPIRQHQLRVLGVNEALNDYRAQSLSHPHISSFSN